MPIDFSSFAKDHMSNLVGGLAGTAAGAGLGYFGSSQSPDETPEQYSKRRGQNAVSGAIGGAAAGVGLPSVYGRVRDALTVNNGPIGSLINLVDPSRHPTTGGASIGAVAGGAAGFAGGKILNNKMLGDPPAAAWQAQLDKQNLTAADAWKGHLGDVETRLNSAQEAWKAHVDDLSNVAAGAADTWSAHLKALTDRAKAMGDTVKNLQSQKAVLGQNHPDLHAAMIEHQGALDKLTEAQNAASGIGSHPLHDNMTAAQQAAVEVHTPGYSHPVRDQLLATQQELDNLRTPLPPGGLAGTAAGNHPLQVDATMSANRAARAAELLEQNKNLHFWNKILPGQTERELKQIGAPNAIFNGRRGGRWGALIGILLGAGAANAASSD